MGEDLNIERAKKITLGEYEDDEPGGMIYSEAATSGNDSEHYFSDLEELIARIQYEKDDDKGALTLEDIPTHVWPCTSVPFSLNAQEIVENALESQEFFEGAYDHIDGEDMEALEVMLRLWCRKVDLKTWFLDTSTVIVLSEEERRVLLEDALDAHPETIPPEAPSDG